MENADKVSTIAIAAIAIIVFTAAFYLARGGTGEREYDLGKLKVRAWNEPSEAVSKALAPADITVQIEAANLSEAVGCRQVAASETVIGLASMRKNIVVQGKLADGSCVAEEKKEVACATPQVVIRQGSANAVIVPQDYSKIIVEGSDEWLCKTAPYLRSLVAQSLSKTGWK